MSDEDANPFSSPQLAAGSGRDGGDSSRGRNSKRPPRIVRYQSGHVRSVAALLSFALAIAGCIGLIIVDLKLIDTVEEIARVAQFSRTPVIPSNPNVALQAAVACLLIVGVLSATITYFCWLHRVYRNLPALGAERLTQSPGWAVAWYFIPFAHLVMPMIAVNEIVQGSDPGGLHEDDGMYDGHTVLVVLWWILNLGSGFMSFFARVPSAGSSIAEKVSAIYFEIAEMAVTIVVLLSTMFLIWIVDQMQTQRFESLVEIKIEPSDALDPDQVDWSAFRLED